MDLTEQRQQVEIDNLRKTIEENQAELENLREELGTAQKEKVEQQAQVTELRTTLKASVQHHKVGTARTAIPETKSSAFRSDFQLIQCYFEIILWTLKSILWVSF